MASPSSRFSATHVFVQIAPAVVSAKLPAMPPVVIVIANHHLPARSEAPRLTGSLFNKHKSLAGEKIDSSRRCFSSEMGWKNALKT